MIVRLYDILRCKVVVLPTDVEKSILFGTLFNLY